MRKLMGAAVVAILLPVMAGAEPISGAAAKEMLFSSRGVDLVMLPDAGLDAAQSATLAAILDQMKGSGFDNYFGAIAVSPTFFSQLSEQGEAAILGGLFQVAAAYHTPVAAADAALNGCNAARKPADAACVLAARMLPRKWKPQPMSLSVFATKDFRQYRKGKGPKALAASAASTAYAIVKGEGAAALALERCNANAAETGSPDCEVVIVD